VFDAIQEGKAPEVNFTVNGTQYGMGYYLANGIYPSWATLVKTISNPVGKKNKVSFLFIALATDTEIFHFIVLCKIPGTM
jgi:hypothetical protein